MAENHSPLEQFTIKRIFDLNLGGIDVSFTNSAAFMIVSIILIGSLMILGARKKLLIPNRWQNLVEITYELVAKTVRDNIGDDFCSTGVCRSNSTRIYSSWLKVFFYFLATRCTNIFSPSANTN